MYSSLGGNTASSLMGVDTTTSSVSQATIDKFLKVNPSLTVDQIATYVERGISPSQIANDSIAPEQTMYSSGLAQPPSSAVGISQPTSSTNKAAATIMGSGLTDIIDPIIGGIGGFQAYNNQQNPNQYVIDPVTGQPIASSTVGDDGVKTNLGTQVGGLNQSAIGGLSDVSQQYLDLYNKAGGNEKAYIQSVVNPVEKAYAQQLADQRMSQGLRGIAGSSIADESLGNTSRAGAQAVADATAKALESSIGIQSGLSTNQMNLAENQAQVGNTIAQQNLASMGLGANQSTASQQNLQNQNDILGRLLSGLAGSDGGSSNLMDLFDSWFGDSTGGTDGEWGSVYGPDSKILGEGPSSTPPQSFLDKGAQAIMQMDPKSNGQYYYDYVIYR